MWDVTISFYKMDIGQWIKISTFLHAYQLFFLRLSNKMSAKTIDGHILWAKTNCDAPPHPRKEGKNEIGIKKLPGRQLQLSG